ncbi:phage holin, lambda family [Serratia symbiotica]|uniref:phage holin, lambda family n=1 Tax=Serratia symbiotica TaxID=138074 RepID=UPI001CF065E9|nr:phage holin, lambda family [Serratia symbiotica]
MKMNNNPHDWPDWIVLFQSWWRGETPIGGVLVSILITLLRVAYTGGGVRKMLLEGALCGALTLTAASCMGLVGLPPAATIALGGAIGFIGVEKVRSVLIRVLNQRLGVSDDDDKPQG